MEKGVCNLVQKYTPEAVRERALSNPEASFQILVSYISPLTFCLYQTCGAHTFAMLLQVCMNVVIAPRHAMIFAILRQSAVACRLVL